MGRKIITCERLGSLTHKEKRLKMSLRQLVGGYPNYSYRNNLGDEGGSVSSLININGNFKDEESWLNGFKKLILHPDFQRSYVVGGEDKYAWRAGLIQTAIHGFTINPVYFGITHEKVFLVIDGQQRMITFADFICGLTFYDISYGGEVHENVNFSNLPKDVQEMILDYELDVVICIGTEEALLAHFRTLNQPTFILNFMELLCSSYTCKMTESLKRQLVRPTAHGKSTMFTDKESPYRILNFSSENGLEKQDKTDVRMEAMRAAVRWAARIEIYEDSGAELVNKISDENAIKLFFENHKNDEDGYATTDVSIKIIDFCRDIFLRKRRGRVDWGVFKKFDSKVGWDMFWLKYRNVCFTDDDKNWISKEFWRIFEMVDRQSVHDQCYLFEYAVIKRIKGEDSAKSYLDEKEALVPFSRETKIEAYNSVNGIDITDGKHYELDEMEFHHAKPRLCGGRSDIENCIPMYRGNHRLYHANGGIIEGTQYNTEILIEKTVRQRKLVEKQRLENGYE